MVKPTQGQSESATPGDGYGSQVGRLSVLPRHVSAGASPVTAWHPPSSAMQSQNWRCENSKARMRL